MAHVPKLSDASLERARRLGVGIAVHPYEYLSNASAPGAGPPLKTILASGIHVGAGSDSAQISTLNPWNMIYYMVTGKNAGGHLVNDGQQITRGQALRLYTADNGWFFREEGALGSIEPGKLGDLVVLSADYFDPAKVPDADLRKLHSVLTVVGGKNSVGRFQDTAQRQPVEITKNGRTHTVLISAEYYQLLTRGRIVRGVEELDADTLKAVAEAEVPEQYAGLDEQLALDD
jgi:cytosine/adenosine deaminase-related metal-dependent hydrolase